MRGPGHVLHWSGSGLAALPFFLLCGGASPYCTQAQDAVAVRAAAVQQEMMVAAFMCRDVASYNRFVISHQIELQETDKALMDFFAQNDAQTGFDDYNLFKTELATASSLRSVRDPQFCRRVNANFAVALGRRESLAQVLLELPYSVETGSVRCPQYAVQTVQAAPAVPAVQTTPVATTTPKTRVRHRTWLGRLVDALFD